jgi:hypothetical protein
VQSHVTSTQARTINSTSGKNSSAAEAEGHDARMSSTGRSASKQALSHAWHAACCIACENMARLLAEISCKKSTRKSASTPDKQAADVVGWGEGADGEP